MQFFLKKLKSDTVLWLYIVCCFVVAVVIVQQSGIIFTHDAKHYRFVRIHVQPVYTIFLRIMRFIFSENYDHVVKWIQLLFVFSSSVFVIRIIKKYFKFSVLINIALFSLLMVPLLGSYRMANKIVTESFAYSLFLLFVAFCLHGIYRRKQKYFYIATGVLSILILTRAQFLSCVPVVFITCWFLWKKDFFKKHYKLAILIICVPFITSFVEKTIYGVVLGHYKSRQLGNSSILTSLIFLSDQTDINLMPDEESKVLFKNSYRFLKEEKLLENQLPENFSFKEKYDFLHVYFPNIMSEAVQCNAIEMFYLPGNKDPEILVSVNKVTGKMLKPLFLKHYSEWFRLYIANLSWPYYSLLSIIGIILICLVQFFNKMKSITINRTLVLYFGLLVLGNAILICIASHSIRRFYMYYDIVLALMILVLLSQTKIRKYITSKNEA